MSKKILTYGQVIPEYKGEHHHLRIACPAVAAATSLWQQTASI